MKNRIKHDKLQQALELLNEAAQEKKEELYELIGGRYSHIKEILTEYADNGKTAANHVKKRFVRGLHNEEKKVMNMAEDLNERIHDNPLLFLGGVALSSFIIGFSLGHKK